MAALPLLVVSLAGVATATHAHGTTDDPALRELVRALGDGTAVGPTMDAVAALGTAAVWQQVGLLLVGVGGVLLLAFGPTVAMVVVLWGYRRLQWLCRVAVDAIGRAARAMGAGVGMAWQRLVGESAPTAATEDTRTTADRSEATPD